MGARLESGSQAPQLQFSLRADWLREGVQATIKHSHKLRTLLNNITIVIAVNRATLKHRKEDCGSAGIQLTRARAPNNTADLKVWIALCCAVILKTGPRILDQLPHCTSIKPKNEISSESGARKMHTRVPQNEREQVHETFPCTNCVYTANRMKHFKRTRTK